MRQEDIPGRLRLAPVGQSAGNGRAERLLGSFNAFEIKDAHGVVVARGNYAKRSGQGVQVESPALSFDAVDLFPLILRIEYNHISDPRSNNHIFAVTSESDVAPEQIHVRNCNFSVFASLIVVPAKEMREPGHAYEQRLSRGAGHAVDIAPELRQITSDPRGDVK